MNIGKKTFYTAAILALLISFSLNAQSYRTVSGHSGNINSIAFSPDSKQMVSCDENGLLIFWNTDGYTNAYSLPTGSNVTSVNFSPDGAVLVYTSYDGTVNLMNASTKEITRNFKVEGNCFNAVYSKDGKHLAAAYSKMKEVKDKNGSVTQQLVDYVNLYETSDYKPYKTIKTGTSSVSIGSIFGTDIFKSYLSNSFNADFSTVGLYFASGGNDKIIRVYSFEYGKFIPSFKGHGEKIFYVTFSGDGEYLASASKDETVKIWNIKTGGSIKTLKGHSGDVNSAGFSGDSKYIATGGDDESVRIWDVKTTKPISTLDGFNFDILTVKFSPDGKYLCAAGENENILIWQTASVLQ